jgi:hypothetical protein
MNLSARYIAQLLLNLTIQVFWNRKLGKPARRQKSDVVTRVKELL